MNSFMFNGQEIAVDTLSPQQRMLLDAVMEAENRVRITERSAFLDRMALEGAKSLFVQAMNDALEAKGTEEAADVQAS